MNFKNLLLILTFFLFFINAAPAYDYYETGKKAYQAGEYEKASQYLSYALKKDPNHLKCRYYYAQVLLKLKEFEKAQKQYEKIIEISPLSYEAKLSSLGISKIEKYRLIKKGIDPSSNSNSSTSGNKLKFYLNKTNTYIENALDAGQVTRWNTQKMPITLYIERPTGLPGYQDSYYSEVMRAMDTWVNNASKSSNISYKLVDNPDQADIRVYFVNEIFKKTGKNYVTGLATPFIRGHILDYYEVKLIPHENLYTTVLHEFGHALGIRGHSSEITDIMYGSVNEAKGLSSRDINTLAFLYSLDPDISNFNENEAIVKDPDKNKKLLGSKNKLLDKKLKEAMEYTKKSPNNVLSWVHLGKAYYDWGKYDFAATSYKKAIEIDPTYTGAIESLAFTYKKMGNLEKAGNLFKTLVMREPANIAFANNYAYFLIENKQYKEAENVLNNLIKANPDAENDENIKQLMDHLSKV